MKAVWTGVCVKDEDKLRAATFSCPERFGGLQGADEVIQVLDERISGSSSRKRTPQCDKDISPGIMGYCHQYRAAGTTVMRTKGRIIFTSTMRVRGALQWQVSLLTEEATKKGWSCE